MIKYFFAAVLFFISGCDGIDNLQDQVDTLNDTLDKTRQDFVAVSNTAIKAVPGERWLQIIDGVMSADPEERRKTREMMERLAGGNIGASYSVTIQFESQNQDDAIYADFAFAASGSINEVTTLVTTNSSILNMNNVFVAVLPPLDSSELMKQYEELSYKYTVGLFDNSASSAAIRAHAADPSLKLFSSDSLAPTPAGEKYIERYKSSLLADIFKSTYSRRDSIAHEPSLSRPWDMLSDDYIIVLLDKGSFDAHADKGLKISYSIHEKDDKEKRYNDAPHRYINLNQFLVTAGGVERQTVYDPSRDRTLMWAPIKITHEFMSAQQILMRNTALEALMALEAENQ